MNIRLLRELTGFYWLLCSIAIIAMLARPLSIIAHPILHYNRTGDWQGIIFKPLHLDSVSYKVFILFGLGVLIQILVGACEKLQERRVLYTLLIGDGDAPPSSQKEEGKGNLQGENNEDRT